MTDTVSYVIETTRRASLLVAAARLEQEARAQDTASMQFKQCGRRYKAREAAHVAHVLRTMAKQVSDL